MMRLRSLVALAALPAGVLTLGCSPEDGELLGEAASALGQPLGSEIEPNGSAMNATPISKDGVVRARISPAGEDDFYSFVGVAGERVYATTVTAFSSGGADSLLDVIAPNGTTVLESDNDNGSLSGTSSSIAGTTITTPGVHYLRVRHNTSSDIRPYDLHLKTQLGTPPMEVEPNDLPFNAQTLPPSGWVAGNISVATDVDIYAFSLGAGDTFFASLDCDPERDGVELAGILSAGPFAGSFLQVNDGGATGPDSEALVGTVKTAGLYGVGVSAASGTGTYHLSVGVHAAAQATCTTYPSAGGVIAIPTGPGLVTSTINVPGNPRVADLDVSVNLNHAAPADLDVVLQAPGGNQVGLFTDVGSATFPDIDITVDDEAAFPASSFTLLNGVAVQPEAGFRLDWLDGMDAGGTWTLRVFDDTANNAGTLLGWSLTVCEAPAAPACDTGSAPATAFTTDFEVDAAGFTHTGTFDTWARGTPAQAPDFTTCNSGASCFKTNLAGNYTNLSTQDLVSPAIDLTGSEAPIRMSWAMKYQLENASFDHAWVEVRETSGANAKRQFEWTGSSMSTTVGNPTVTVQEVAGWGLYTANLDAYAGKTVELVFHVDADVSNTFPGVAIDDVKVTACPAQTCGNGVMEGTEQCDDSNVVSGDGCDANCTTTACGNGIATAGETCDDGNVVSGDGCDVNCTPTGCGNGVATAGETCDDGNAVEGDGCDSNCTASACGNNITAPGEMCDDGNVVSGDGCDANCTMTACGNGIATAGETCDDGTGTNGDGCDDGPGGNCTPSACGNAVVAGEEICDDGNAIEGDGCDSNCTLTGCGNGVMSGAETCDDGNATNGDGCDDGRGGNCTPTACGNGVQTGAAAAAVADESGADVAGGAGHREPAV